MRLRFFCLSCPYAFFRTSNVSLFFSIVFHQHMFFRFLVQINCLATLTTSFITLWVHTIGYTKRLQVLLMIKIKVNFFVNEFYLIFYTLHDNDCENDTVFAFLYNMLWCQSLWKIARKAMRITQSNLVIGAMLAIIIHQRVVRDVWYFR